MTFYLLFFEWNVEPFDVRLVRSELYFKNRQFGVFKFYVTYIEEVFPSLCDDLLLLSDSFRCCRISLCLGSQCACILPLNSSCHQALINRAGGLLQCEGWLHSNLVHIHTHTMECCVQTSLWIPHTSVNCVVLITSYHKCWMHALFR